MGKARIVSGGTGGLYQIRIERDIARVQRRIDALTLARARLAAQIAEALSVRAAAADALLLATGAATAAWGVVAVAGPDDYQQALRAAGEAEAATQKAVGVLALADSRIGLLRLDDQAAEADIRRLQAIPEYITGPAWCADLTETLAPDTPVGLMIPGDERAPGVSPVIRPGYGGAAAYSVERDGVLQPIASSTPWQAAQHLLRMPYRQRWKPRVRTAVITSIDGDRCAVLLDDQRVGVDERGLQPSVRADDQAELLAEPGAQGDLVLRIGGEGRGAGIRPTGGRLAAGAQQGGPGGQGAVLAPAGEVRPRGLHPARALAQLHGRVGGRGVARRCGAGHGGRHDGGRRQGRRAAGGQQS